MKVLILHSELGVLRGGGENFTRNLFSAFARRGHEVTAAFVADRNSRYPIPLPANITPIPLAGYWSTDLGQATLSSLGRYLAFQGRPKASWNRLQEVIHWRTFRWHNRRFQRRVESEFARRWGDFDAVYVHGDVRLASDVAQHRPTVLRLPGPVSAELAPTMRTIHAVCANGDALRRIRAFLGDEALELPIGLDRERFSPGSTAIRSSLGWTELHRVVGYVGRLTYVKGIDLLAAAFHEISPLMTDVRLLIIGRGETEKGLRSILRRELDQGLVHIEADVHHDGLPEWYRAINLLVMPSRYENFSNAILEAMACGVPFLASDVGGNRILAETGAGWLFEPGSVSSLSARLLMILGNCVEMRACGNIGAGYVRTYHSWAASAECLEKIMISRLGVKG